jgi:hypothetical protein
MTIPGFTAAASYLKTSGHYSTLSGSSAPRSTVRPQLDERDYAAEDPADLTRLLRHLMTSSRRSGNNGSRD